MIAEEQFIKTNVEFFFLQYAVKQNQCNELQEFKSFYPFCEFSWI